MSRRTAALGEGLNDGWHVIIFIREPNDGQVATEAQIARQVRQVGDLRVHHKRSCHLDAREVDPVTHVVDARSEEHTSELQSLMRISYAVFCLKKKKQGKTTRMQDTYLSTTYDITCSRS